MTDEGEDTLPSRPYGSDVRSQVFEVIVRQAMAGAPWQKICAKPMMVNQITADEVEEEVSKRFAAIELGETADKRRD